MLRRTYLSWRCCEEHDKLVPNSLRASATNTMRCALFIYLLHFFSNTNDLTLTEQAPNTSYTLHTRTPAADLPKSRRIDEAVKLLVCMLEYGALVFSSFI